MGLIDADLRVDIDGWLRTASVATGGAGTA